MLVLQLAEVITVAIVWVGQLCLDAMMARTELEKDLMTLCTGQFGMME
jgi:hypothetical protein